MAFTHGLSHECHRMWVGLTISAAFLAIGEKFHRMSKGVAQR